MRRSSFFTLLAAVTVLVAAVACATRPVQLASTGPIVQASGDEMGRSELWAAHCTRCHNLRPRTEYSPAQWSVIVNHMRTVADLTGEDYRRLLEFLADRAPAAGNTEKVVATRPPGTP